MITILHGDNTVASRAALNQKIQADRMRGVQVDMYSIDALSVAEVETRLGTSTLFLSDQLIVLEGALSGVMTSFKKKVIELANQTSINVLFWEGKELSSTALKPFGQTAQVQLFPLTKKIWSWLDSVRPANGMQSVQLLSEAERQDGVELCFVMLIGLVRKMILVKDGCAPKQAPFAAKKLQAQTASFSWEKLLAMQALLLKTDMALKSSTSILSLRAELDLFLLAL